MRSFRKLAMTALALITSLAAATAWAEDKLYSVVGDGMVYLYWNSDSGDNAVLYRALGDKPYKELARPRAITDPVKANQILSTSPDVFSKGLTVSDDFVKKAETLPAVDQAVTRVSIGYSIVRARGYLDRDIVFGERYRYLLLDRPAEEKGRILGEVVVVTSKRSGALSPTIEASLSENRPQVTIHPAPLVRYQVERADKADGPYHRLTMLPLVSEDETKVILHPDNTALLDGREYYYRVIPANAFDVTGSPSAVIRIATPDKTPPPVPKVDVPKSLPAAAALSWQNPADADFSGVRIYRREVSKGKEGKLQSGPELLVTAKLLDAQTTQYEDHDVVPGRIYQYELTALDRAGNESEHAPGVLARPRDVIPPAIPRGLTAKGLEQGVVKLSWNASSDADLFAYRLYRNIDNVAAKYPITTIRVDTLKPGKLVEYDDHLDANSQSTYQYSISALDKTENESPRTAPVDARLPDHLGPAAPIITAVTAVNGGIEISWVASVDKDVAGYRVYRGENIDSLSLLDKDKTGVATTYKDANVKSGVTYFYAIAGVDRSGNVGEKSQARSAATYVQAPATVPTGLHVTNKITPWKLGWLAPQDASGFIVYVSADREGGYRQTGAVVHARTMDIPAPNNQQKLWYKVQAIYSGGAVSALSEPIVVSNLPR